MIDINLNKISKNYGFGDVLKDISLEIKQGEIVALIGDNGSGKTTILKMIIGIEKPTSGIISIRKDAKIGYLSQIPEQEEDKIKVKDILYRSVNNILEKEQTLKNYEEKMEKAQGKDLEKIIAKYTNLQEEFISAGGYEISEKIGKIVKGFKINHLLDLYYNNLSGGEKRIVNFAALMIKNPDILLLDEPTNHLDIETLEWLENYLKNYKGTIVMVTHDRYFLDKINAKIVLVENKTIDIYYGNYSYFIIEKEKRDLIKQEDYNNQQKEIKRMKESAKKLREFGGLGGNERFYKRAKAIEKRIDKIDRIGRPQEQKDLPLEFKMKNRSGEDVLIVKRLDIAYGDKTILEKANMNIKYNEHVCIIGKNGSGKSSLIKEIIKNNNESIKLGSNIKIGYISQEISFDNDSSIIEIASEYFKDHEAHLRSALHKFMFTKDDIYKRVSKLSGGEKVRLKLFCLMQENVNFLILDEPTNHIDIKTREVLEKTLNEYQGTILFISHDRYFINKIANKIISIEGKKLIEYIGNYDDYKNTIIRMKKH